MPFDCSTDAAGTCVAMPSSKVNDTMVCALALEALEAEQRRTTKSVARMTRPAHAQRAIGRRTVAMRGVPSLGAGGWPPLTNPSQAKVMARCRSPQLKFIHPLSDAGLGFRSRLGWARGRPAR